MMSLKSLSKFMYVFYYGVFCFLSIALYGSFGLISLLVMNSKNVLFITNMVSFHKMILLILLFSIISWFLLYIFTETYKFTGIFDHLVDLKHIFKKIVITSFIGFTCIALYYQIGIMIGHPFAREIIEMNVLAIIIFLGIIDISKYLARNYNQLTTVVLSALLIVLFTKSLIAILNGYVPVEFSSVAYLFVPLVFVLRIKKLYVVGSYISALAGFIYFIYIIINGGATYNVIPSIEVYRSMLSHGTLLLIGLITLSRLEFHKNNIPIILGYMVSNILWAISNRPEQISFRLFIYEMVDGNFLEILFRNPNPLIYFSYYMFILAFLIWSVKVFGKINMKWHRHANLIDVS